MNKNKIGTLFLVSALALAGIGISYAGFTDTISIFGEVDTATVVLDVIDYSGTDVYKVWDVQDDVTPPNDDMATYEHENELLIYRGMITDLPSEQTVIGWAEDNGGSAERVSFAKASADPCGVYDVLVEFDNLFPCVPHTADIVVEYTGSIPAKLWASQDIEYDATNGPNWVDSKDWIEYLYDDTDAITYEIYSYDDGIIGDTELGLGHQVHEGDMVYIAMTIHIPQDNIYQGCSAEFWVNIHALQWNEGPDTPGVDFPEPGRINTLQQEVESAPDYDYPDGYEYGDVEFDAGTNTFSGTYSQDEVNANKPMFDMARFLGALYRQDCSTIIKITFEGIEYTWNTSGTLKGSNWEDEDGTTLVSMMADDYESSPGPLTVTVSDCCHDLDVTFEFSVLALSGYGVAISAPQNFGDGGWAGWSAPAGKVVTGGGFQLTGGPAAASAPGTPDSVWPHYTYGPDEYGWVVQDASDGSGSPDSYVYAIYADLPEGYEIIEQTVTSFSPGGWGGWSAPAGKVVLGGGFVAEHPVKVSAPAGPNSAWPHYAYGADEYGWVVQNGGTSQDITIYVICADMPAGYEIIKSGSLNYGDGGWAGWSAPAGKVVTGGGFQLTGGPAAASAPGTPGSVWPHYTYGPDEYGWVVQDASDGSGSPGSYVYVICVDEP
jgi:hypothetical protein